MRIIKNFDEFMANGIVKKQTPDISRANYLSKESEKSRVFLQNIIRDYGITDDSANSIIKLCYDIIMELIRSNMLRKGFNSSGQGAHEAEVSYLRKLSFSNNDVQFADQLRYFRNGIVYYGKILNAEYAKKVVSFMKSIYPKLKVNYES